MADCRKCKHNYKMPGDEPRCNRMCDGESDFEAITNADKIRSMSDEELADMIHNIGSYIEDGEPLIDIYIGENKSTIDDSVGFIMEWLQSEAE